MKKTIALLSFSCLLFIQAVFAQTNLDAPLPHDPEMVVGKLPNGMTYYLRHNKEPKERASFYIIQNVGALLENDDQNGLAHFLEHMAFQGTKHFPGKKIITTLEKHGVAFGRNLNAYTAFNETVYNISAVPTTNPKLLDTCLLILHDWSNYLTLSDKEIDAERGVITEEWRTRRNSRARINEQLFPVLFKGSKYAERDVIGSLDVIQNFKYQTIKDFYNQWYRSDLQAIAIVGDFDVKEMEEKVKALFSKIPAVENPSPRPSFEIPAHDEMYYVLATDKEATSSSIQVSTIAPNKESKNTHLHLKNSLIHAFFNNMINARLSEILQQANPPYVNGYIYFGAFVRGYSTYAVATTAKPNEEAIALETIVTENERIKRFGFTASELERAKTNMLVSLESSYKQKDKANSEGHIRRMQNHFLEQEPMVSTDYYHQFANEIIPTITLEEVNAKVKEWNTEENRTVAITGPSENAKHLTEEEVVSILEKVSQAEITPYVDAVSDAALINEELIGSKITKTKQVPELKAVEWTLANGAKVVFRKANYDKDRVALSSYSEGGSSLYGMDMIVSAQNASSLVGSFGLGDFDAITLNKVLTGKIANCSVSIDDLSESVNGSSTPKDFETMLQLLYLRFEHPRFDKEIFESNINRDRSMLPNYLKTPQKIMQDSIQLTMTNYHPRSFVYNEEYLNKIDFKQIEQIYRDRIKDASDFTFFIVGNIDEDTVRPLVEKYIGSLKSENRKESGIDHQIKVPVGKTVKVIELDLETPKATVVINLSKEMKNSIHRNLSNFVLKGILDLRFTENIREKEGGTYGVNVQASAMRVPYSKYSMNIKFDCDPDKAERLKSLVYKELKQITEQAPTQEEMDKVTLSLLKNREQSKNHNSFWMDAIYNYYVKGINSADSKNFEEVVEKLSPKTIQKFAKSLFDDANIVDFTFMPKEK